MAVEADAPAYLRRLARAIACIEGGPGEVDDILRERIYPMILEWNALPFLPPPELLAFFDAYLGSTSGEAWIRNAFNVELRSADDVALSQLLAEELEGLGKLPVRQAMRARALAIACPTAALDGSYVGPIPELRALIKRRGLFFGAHDEPRPTPEELFGGLDVPWMATQVRSWSATAIRSFLSGRLRPRDGLREQVHAGVDKNVQPLIDLLRAVADAPRLDSAEALFEAVRARPAGQLEGAVLRRVLPLVAVDDPAWAHQELPTGGYADLSTKGSFDRLLLSNLAYPEEEFARRFVEGELLYYELEAPPSRQPPKQYVLLDASPATWGVPRLAGAAVALGVLNRARERRAEVAVLGAGRQDRPFENLDRAAGVFELLDFQRWEDALPRELDQLLARARAETKDHPSGADLFVCTEAGRLGSVERWAKTADLPAGLRLHAFASDVVDGRAALWRHEAGGFLRSATLSLAAKELLPPPAVPALGPAPAGGFAPSGCQVNWDWGGNVSCAAIAANGLAVTGHENGELHLWDAVRGAHLEHRHTFPSRVLSVAISGDWIAGLIRTEDTATRSLFHAPLRDGPVRQTLISPPVRRGGIRASWVPGRFFAWFGEDNRLVEWDAAAETLVVHMACRKSPAHNFLVSTADRAVVWKQPTGGIASFDLKQIQPVARRRYVSVLLNEVAHLAIDPEGRLAVRLSSTQVDAQILRLEGEQANDVLPRSQAPHAVNAAADRLLCANSDAIWFWALAERRNVKHLVSPRQVVKSLIPGYVDGVQGVSALRIEFDFGIALAFHWNPGRGEDSLVVAPVTGGRFAGRKFWKANAPLPREGGELGAYRVSWGDRRIELVPRRRPEDAVRFWFRQAPGAPQWVLASDNLIAGNSLDHLVTPVGRTFLCDPGALARRLAAGTAGRA